MRTDDGDDRLTHEEIREQYGWKDDAERAEARAEAERLRQQIAGEKVLREAWEAREKREAAAALVTTKSAPVTQHRAAAAAQAAPDWDAWRRFIIATVDKKFISDKMLEKVVKAVREYVEEGDISVCTATKEAREKALEPLREEIVRLKVEIAELRGAALQRSQPVSAAAARQRAGALVRARAEVAALRAGAVKCEGEPQNFDIDQLRDQWRH